MALLLVRLLLFSQQETPPPPPAAPVCVSPGQCFAQASELAVEVLSPAMGPLDGATRVVVVGRGFRDFGSLMRCRFGTQESKARLAAPPGGYINPYNHTLVSCQSPAAPTPFAQTVDFELSLNGQDYSSSKSSFHYYRHPLLTGVSPEHGSASKSQVLTLSRSIASESGGWLPTDDATRVRCRYASIVQPEGRRQVPFVAEVNATVVDDTELLCATPLVPFVAPVSIDVTLNGQQYGIGGPAFGYEDNWHSPGASGTPPSARHGAAAALVGRTIYLFGGEDGGGFVGDLCALHLDTMGECSTRLTP